MARLVLALLLVMAGTFMAAGTSDAATFTVNTTSNTNDGTCNAAHCSLFEALTAAQAAGPHTIAFNIPGSGVRTITIGGPCLPGVSQPVTIDGYTQPGSSPNTNATGAINAVPLIELRGTPACAVGLSVVFPQANLVVKGLILNGFSSTALSASLTTLTVEGSFIGTTADGLSAHAPDSNIAGNGISTDNASLIIGGTTPAARNVLSGNRYAIQHVGNGTGVLQGNLIGTNKLGTARVANRAGYMALGGCAGGNITSQIGGDTAAARNVISGNVLQAILLGGYAGVGCGEMRATNSFVKGNYIGTDITGTAPLGNAWAGENRAAVEVQNGPNVSIGGPAPGEGNVIAFNGFQGVVMHHGLGFNRTGLRILGNRIHSNGALGIDLLGAAGVTANDAGDVDTSLQNFPVVTGVIRNGASTTIQGTLSSLASRTYRIELFVNDAADASSHGEGQVFLLATNVTTNGSGSASFSMPVPVAIGPTQYVTATATANDGEGNTSEFSELTTDLSLTHADTPDPAAVNQNVTHTLTVTNTGTIFPSGPVTLTFTAAPGATIVNDDGGTTVGSAITFSLGTLPAGGTAVRTVVLRHASLGAKTSTATVTSAINDPTPANNTAAATTTVTVPPTLYTISGQVRDLNDTGVPGVTMTLSGSQATTLTTDLDGRYVFTGLPAGGTYTVAPSNATFAFNPPSQTFPNLAKDEVAQFFVAQVGTFTRYFAEGATGNFFDTQLALLNATGQPAVATVTFQRPAPEPEVSTVVNLTGLQRVTIDPKALGLTTAEFSTVITSTQPIVADRTMTWDPSGYGSHAETSVGRPLTQWFLAEGATINGFDLFYLIQNPGDVTAEVQVRYLLPAPAAPIVKTYSVAPRSRFNIWVNTEDPALDEAELSASITVTNDVPVIVERAMYRPVGTQLFGAGHESMGVEAPALEWFFGEGATGAFFDLFFLIANPSAQVAQLEARYLKPDGTVITRTYAVPANSRFNIWVDFEGPELADTAVSTTLRVLNDVPVVAERAMWWPGTFTTWHEGHNTAGATAVGEKWALAEGEVGGARGLETYILIGNTSPTAGTARVTLTFEDGTQATKDITLPANSRTNVATSLEFPAAVGKRFGTVVESLGTTPAQIVVERAMYSNAGAVQWAAGTSALATRLR